MRRLLVVTLVLALVSSVAHAVTIPRGSRELIVEGLFDSDTMDSDLTDITVVYGEYPEDNLEMGFQFRVRDTDNSQQWRAGMRIEINKPDFEVMPFMTFTLEYASIDYEGQTTTTTTSSDTTTDTTGTDPAATTTTTTTTPDRSDEAVVVGVHAGLKWFLAENVAVAGAFVYEWASEDIFAESDGAYEASNQMIQLGMRFFF